MVTKPNNIRQEYYQALAQYRTKLQQHVWSFQTGSFYDFDRTVKKERDLYADAVRLGMDGVMTFVQEQMEAIENFTRPAVEQAYNRAKEGSVNQIAYLEKALEETRQKYMKPIDFFKEKIDRYDFWWDMSDDGGVLRAGQASLDSIEADIKKHGAEFAKVWSDYRAEQIAASERSIAKQRADREERDKLQLHLEFIDNTSSVKAVCDHWMAMGRNEEPKPAGLVGHSVWFGKDFSGSTTRIVVVSRKTKRFMTSSGSVYQFGEPSPQFKVDYPNLCAEAGFN
jgi:hypothetical protein